MVLPRKKVGRILKRGGALALTLAAFAGGYAFKGIQSSVSCTVTGSSALPLAATVTCADNITETVFTQALANTTIAAFECLPQLYVDTEQILSCLTPIGGSLAGALLAVGVGAFVGRKLSYFQSSKKTDIEMTPPEN